MKRNSGPFYVQSHRLRRNVTKMLTNFTARLRRAKHAFMVLAVIVIGILASFGAILIRYMIKVSYHSFFGVDIYSLAGKEVHLLYPEYMADAGAYALVAGTTHTPITAILIIFKLTYDYHIIPPLMVSCIIVGLISSYLKKESMYTMKLVGRGINIFEGRDINILRALTVKDVLNTDVETIQAGDGFNDIIKRLLKNRVPGVKDLMCSYGLHTI